MPVHGAADGGAAEFVFGMHAVRHALAAAPERVRELLLQADREPNAALREILAQVQTHGIAVRRVSRAELDSESGYGRHQGVALRRAPAAGRVADLEDLLPSLGHDALVLVLDGVQDPHNLGACVRTADAAGAGAVIIPQDRAAPMTDVAVKAAAGAAEHIPVLAVKNLCRALEQLKKAGLWVFGTGADAVVSVHEADFRRPLALVLGGEGAGMRRNVAEHCDVVVRIPLAGHVESLNVSVAAGICLFEVRRQRRAQGRT
jgi:23S rRNA (guanosine2251-2'-O)-methyltransferase